MYIHTYLHLSILNILVAELAPVGLFRVEPNFVQQLKCGKTPGIGYCVGEMKNTSQRMFSPDVLFIVCLFVCFARRKDVFSGTAYQAEGFNLEQASVLYNMGALHSQLGSRESRVSEQEMKEACTHFQCAAGAFVYLLVRKNPVIRIHYIW